MLELGVAKELGKTLGQLRDSCTRDDLLIWSAYFSVLNENQENEIDKARKQNKGAGRGRMR
jgi:hypothetical protein